MDRIARGRPARELRTNVGEFARGECLTRSSRRIATASAVTTTTATGTECDGWLSTSGPGNVGHVVEVEIHLGQYVCAIGRKLRPRCTTAPRTACPSRTCIREARDVLDVCAIPAHGVESALSAVGKDSRRITCAEMRIARARCDEGFLPARGGNPDEISTTTATSTTASTNTEAA